MRRTALFALTFLSTATPALAQQNTYNWGQSGPPTYHNPNHSPPGNQDNLVQRNQIMHDNRTTSTVVFGPRGEIHTCRTQHIGGNPTFTTCQ